MPYAYFSSVRPGGCTGVVRRKLNIFNVWWSVKCVVNTRLARHLGRSSQPPLGSREASRPPFRARGDSARPARLRRRESEKRLVDHSLIAQRDLGGDQSGLEHYVEH